MPNSIQYYKKNPNKLKALLIILLPWYCTLAFSLNANFTYEQVTACTPSRVIFHNQSAHGSGIHFEWDFGLGATSTNNATELEQVYTESGNFEVTLFAIEGTDTLRQTKTIVVKKSPEAKFELDYYSGCAPFNAVFHNTTTLGDAPLSKAEWDLRDGTFYNDLETLTKTYTKEGNYGAILTVTDQNGCSDFFQMEDLIEVKDKLKIDIEVNDSVWCHLPFTAHFSAISSGNDVPLEYNWDFDEGTTSIAKDTSLLYVDPGIYNVKLTASNKNGCTASDEKKITILWADNDIEILAYQFDTLVTSEMFCNDTIVFKPSVVKNIEYKWKVRTITSDDYFVSGPELQLNGWGLFFVDLTLYYGVGTSCMDSVQRTITYYDKRNYSILMDHSFACSLPQTVSLSAETSDTNITNVQWQFSDGTVQNGLEVSHTFDASKTYKEIYGKELTTKEFPITMTALSGNGCRISLSERFKVTEPLARFSLDKTNGCVPLNINIDDKNKSHSDIAKTTYYIDGQEIIRNNSINFNHIFTKPGQHDIFSVVENIDGCTDTSYTRLVETGKKLQMDLQLADTVLCVGDKFSILGNTELKDSVDFWQFNSPGIFNVSSKENLVEIPDISGNQGEKNIITSIDFNGCVSESVFTNAYRIEGPTGYITDTFNCGLPFDYTFYPVLENADSIFWRIDNTIYHQYIANHEFYNNSDYNVELFAFNKSTGCNMKTSKIVKVRNVKADFNVDPINCGLAVDVDGRNSNDYIDDCYNEGFLWYWGNNDRPDRTYDPIKKHFYTEPGDYTIELHALADNGCTDTIKKETKVIHFEPSFDVEPQNGCIPEFTVDFERTSTQNDILYWTWDFGDGKKTKLFNNTSHKYESEIGKTWYATLKETDKYGCDASTSKVIEITRPSSGFSATATKACVGQEIIFRPYDIYNATFHIDFGDGNSSSSTLSHTYTSQGTYSVTLTTTKNGCNTTTTKTNYIEIINPSADYHIDTSNVNCYPAVVTFTYNPEMPVWSRRWETGDNGTFITADNTVKYTYSEPGTYNTSLTVRTFNNCIAYAQKTIEIKGPEANLSFSPHVICYKEEVSFNANNLKNVDELTWIFGDGQTSNEPVVQHIYNSHGSIKPKVVISNESCEKTIDAGTLSVRHFRGINGYTTNEYCLDDNWNKGFSISYFTIPQNTEWLLNDVTISNELYLPEMSLREMGATVGENTLTIKMQNAMCNEEVTHNITVYDTLTFTINGADSVCKGATSELWVDNMGDWEIEWETIDQISARNLWFDINITPDGPTYYTAIVTDENGCKTSQTKLINIMTDPGYYKKPEDNIFINLGESVTLTIVSESEGTRYKWDPSTFLSCTDCNSTTASPKNDMLYFVEIINSCSTKKEHFKIEVYNDFYIEAPTAFTPNNDGKNDVFSLIMLNIEEILEFKIFNRWGNIVFSTDQVDEGWDGKLNGKLQEAGTYAYFVRAKNIFGFELEKKGSITLLK